MSDSGKNEPVTRYLMYKVGLQSGDVVLSKVFSKSGSGYGLTMTAAECLENISRNSAKDATLLYACVMEAQSTGDKKEVVNTLGRVLDKYDYSAPTGIHLPALLRYDPTSAQRYKSPLKESRCTARLLQSDILREGVVEVSVTDQLCKVFEGGW
jgi:hypothetical protein